MTATDSGELVTVKTRVPRVVADELAELAAAHDRSMAAELRRAIDDRIEEGRNRGTLKPRRKGKRQ